MFQLTKSTNFNAKVDKSIESILNIYLSSPKLPIYKITLSDNGLSSP